MTPKTGRPSPGVLRSVRVLSAVAGLCVSPGADGKTVDATATTRSGLADSTLNEVRTVVSSDTPHLRRLFSELHEDTQAGHVEALRAAVIANELVALGLDVEFGTDGSEVIAVLRQGVGPTLLYRADTGADLTAQAGSGSTGPAIAGSAASAATAASAVAGAVSSALPAAALEHRCGYDAQIVWLLGMAKALVALRSEWSGTLVVVAQPTRRLVQGGPLLKATTASPARQLPKPDVVMALNAGTAPVGSVLSVRGRRTVHSEQVGVTVGRYGIYDRPDYADDVSRLAAGTMQLYGFPEGGAFGYLVVGVAEPSLAASSPDEFDAAPLFELQGPTQVDFAAIPLGAKLAAVAVLDLLKRKPPNASVERSRLNWTPHRY
jgi:hypothetical protein